MNRDERSKIMMQTRQFMSIVDEQCSAYHNSLDESAQREARKLENMPDALLDSENSNHISESMETLESAIDAVEEISNLLNQLPDLLDIRIRKPRQKTICGNFRNMEPCEIYRTSEKRTERLQLVVTPTLAAALKRQSGQMKISTNELINRILLKNLETLD